MICKTKDCEELAYLLSWHDTPERTTPDGIRTVKRDNKYKCSNNHISIVTVKAEIDLLKKPDKAIDSSMKRFHRKGFTGHKVNPAKQVQSFFPAEMTNNEKNEWRRNKRNAERKLKEDAKAKQP